MTLISAHFEQLYFANCNLEKPLIYNSKIIIPTRQLGLLPDHPLNTNQEMIFLSKAYLIFDGVKKSVRQLTGYIESSPDSRHFKPLEENSRIVVDDDFPDFNGNVSLFGLEGVFDEPLEWVDWEIESASFYLMEHPADNWDFTELWIDVTAFPLKVLVLVIQSEGISFIYDPSRNYQLVFFSFTYEDATLWLQINQYKPVEQRFKKEIYI